jgi:putative NADPH-quinone reductase
MPALLQVFWMYNFTRFAYKYINGRPHGLLTGKTAEIIVSTGGPKIFYSWLGGKLLSKF